MTSGLSVAPTAQRSSHFTLVLDVTGMKCAGCVGAVEKNLHQYPGVHQVTVNLLTGVATLDCDASADIDPLILTQRLNTLGFPAQLRYDPRQPVVSAAVSSEAASSRKAERQPRQFLQEPMTKLAIATLLVSLSALGHLGHIHWLHQLGFGQTAFHWGLATLALLGPGLDILISGWRGIRQGAPNMNTLVALGAVTAYGTSAIAQIFPQLGWECFFDEPVMLIGAIVLGRGLEEKARQKALSTLKVLSERQPPVARLWCGSLDAPVTPVTSSENSKRDRGQGLEIPIERVCLGDYLQVLAGETIPVDGELIQGQSTVNEAMITGEPIPVDKHPGDRVLAGTINYSQPIWIRTTATGTETTLARIINLVETAQTRKAPIQHLADQVAGYFVYGVIGLAILTFGFWYLLGTQIWPQVLVQSPVPILSGLSLSAHHTLPTTLTMSPLLLSVKLAIAVLVVSCPCALGLATPVSILVGTSVGAEHGLLIRGGDVLEELSRVDTWVFDKTGTLTIGSPDIVDLYVVNPEILHDWNSDLTPSQALLQIAASVEQETRHPLSDAILKAAQTQQIKRLPARNTQVELGSGVSAEIAGQLVQAGRLDWLEKNGLIALTNFSELPGEGADLTPATTRVYLAIDHQLVGLITLMDTVRPEAKATLSQLKDAGQTVKLLTGDRRDSAVRVAQEVGLDLTAVIAEVDPEQKVQYITHLQELGHQIAMVGDGLNDAPALTQANVGIALQSSTDAALASAGVVILSNQLQDILSVRRLSQLTLQKVRQNLAWSIGYNLVGIPLAMGCFLPVLGLYLSPATAGAMMCLSSISVILNSLSLRRVRLKYDI